MNQMQTRTRVLLLPGQSQRNRLWASQLEAILAEDYEVEVHDYEHWKYATADGSDSELDFGRELKRLGTRDDVVVIAKSAGTMLALLAMRSGHLRPRACLFMGMPLNWKRAKGFDFLGLLKKVRDKGYPIHIIQNTRDPMGSREEIKKLLGHGCLTSLAFPAAEDHRYECFCFIHATVGRAIRSLRASAMVIMS